VKSRRQAPELIVQHSQEAEAPLGQGKAVAPVRKRSARPMRPTASARRQYNGTTRDATRRLIAPEEGEP